MKKTFYLLLLVILASCTGGKQLEMNVMTFNIRYDNPGDSLNNWKYRKDVAAQIIKSNKADIIGTQEVLFNQLNDLKERLPEYTAVGVGRQDGINKGEYAAVLYKKNRFNEVESGYFWLSETPEVAGSKGWDGACERIATWVILQDKSTEKKLVFVNTHLDHVGKQARQEGVTLLLNRAKSLAKGLPVIITGDFNATPESDVIKHVTGNNEFHDSRMIAESISLAPGTYHDYGKIPAVDREIIDYIFVTDPIQVSSYQIIPEQLNDTYLSDHNPVVAGIIIP